jgi:hypothetical protein
VISESKTTSRPTAHQEKRRRLSTTGSSQEHLVATNSTGRHLIFFDALALTMCAYLSFITDSNSGWNGLKLWILF